MQLKLRDAHGAAAATQLQRHRVENGVSCGSAAAALFAAYPAGHAGPQLDQPVPMQHLQSPGMLGKQQLQQHLQEQPLQQAGSSYELGRPVKRQTQGSLGMGQEEGDI